MADFSVTKGLLADAMAQTSQLTEQVEGLTAENNRLKRRLADYWAGTEQLLRDSGEDDLSELHHHTSATAAVG